MRLLLQACGALGWQLAQLADEAVEEGLIAEVCLRAHLAIPCLFCLHLQRMFAPADLLTRVYQILPERPKLSKGRELGVFTTNLGKKRLFANICKCANMHGYKVLVINIIKRIA